jgi:hypothetical protein
MTLCIGRSEPALPALKLDALVNKLNELQRTASLEHFLRVGRLIVTEVYGGDLTQWRLNKEHDISFRQLASRTEVDLQMSVTSLYRAVALYDLCSRLPVPLWRDFGAGHLRAVLGLPEPEQVRLLSAAKVNQWTARQLYSETKQRRGRIFKEKAGEPPVVRLMRQLLSRLRERPPGPDELESKRLANLVRDLRQALSRLEPESAADRFFEADV